MVFSNSIKVRVSIWIWRISSIRCLQIRLFYMTFLKRKSLVIVSWSNVVDMLGSSFDYNKKNTEYILYSDEILYRIQRIFCGELNRSLRVLIRSDAAQQDYIYDITYVRNRCQWFCVNFLEASIVFFHQDTQPFINEQLISYHHSLYFIMSTILTGWLLHL